MLNIIFLLITGSVFAYLSKDNLTPVTMNLAQYTFSSIPLFYVIIGSLLVGLTLGYIIQIFGAIATAFLLRGNQRAIKSGQNEVLELTKRLHQLELENESLKNTGSSITDSNAL